MSNNNSRALRRFHRARLIKKYSQYQVFAWREEEDRRKMAICMVNHISSCSCYMCGNQRHNNWQSKKECLSMQERKAVEAFKYEMEEMINE